MDPRQAAPRQKVFTLATPSYGPEPAGQRCMNSPRSNQEHMSTESIARSVIASAESAPEARPSTLSTPEESNAHEYADVAGQEFDHYIADDPQSVTRRAAAA